MKFRFDPNQQFQLEAVKSVVGVFEGQPQNELDFSAVLGDANTLFQDNSVGNRLMLSEEQLLENVREVQTEKSNAARPTLTSLTGWHTARWQRSESLMGR